MGDDDKRLLDVGKVKALREALGWNQQQAADAADFAGGRQQWNSIERGTRASITLETLGKMARALGVQPSELLTKIVIPKKGRGKAQN